MSEVFAPGPRPRTVRDSAGAVRDVPAGWELLPPGDPACTRRVKAGPHWVVQEQRGRKVFTRGVWAPADDIAAIREALVAERGTEAYARKAASGLARREKIQARYEGDFEAAVLAFLDFAPAHVEVAHDVARRVTAHATPVGSGTVARTERIPIEERAQAAVIAWMRHQTTAYDHMAIAREKGRRREVRRELAAKSREVLRRYREGREPAAGCPLRLALLAPAPARTPTPKPPKVEGPAPFARSPASVAGSAAASAPGGAGEPMKRGDGGLEPAGPPGPRRSALFARFKRRLDPPSD